MRSRYSAYVLGLEDYLLQTWNPQTRPLFLNVKADGRRWTGLKIIHYETTGDAAAMVEFIARYKAGGRPRDLHEKSRFVKEEGRWFYVDGIISEDT